MRDERSAGVVVFLHGHGHSTPEQIGDPSRRFLLLNYGRHWDFAKGHVEPGETDHQAAVRELFEETGISDAKFVDGFVREVDYYFRSSRHGVVHKTVVFFLATTETSDVKISAEHVGFTFLDFDKALAKVSYASAREILRAAEGFLAAKPPTDQSIDQPERSVIP